MSGVTDDDDNTRAKDADFCKKWTDKIAAALKREKEFRKQAKMCVELYEARQPEHNPFAILYSNTETLQPALYNATPVPVVERRFKDADPIGKVASETSTRLLKYLIEAESAEDDNFDELMQPAVLDVLVTNRGITRFKYDADTSQGKVLNECVYGDAVRYDKFLHGYARTWKKVPWIAFEHDMSKDEMKENFPNWKGELNFENLVDSWASTEDSNEGLEKKTELTGVRLAKIYEVWDKTNREVFFLCPGCEEPLKKMDDPLKLSGFFPTPKPLNLMKKVSTMIPTPLYIQYQAQARELNDLTVRLRYLIKALKVRGFYNATITGIEKVLTAEDNELIAAENMAAMPEGIGLDKAIWLMPLEALSTTVRNLYLQREQVKQVIYEITGVSDILRGASVASETATAQNIKNQWGTLRLKKMQKEIQRYVRDCLRIMLEIAVTKFSVGTVSAMTGLEYPTEQQKAQATQQVQMIMAQAQQAAQQAAMQAQMTGQQSQPPQPPEIPPQLQEIVEKPTWEQILGLLKNDTLRSYKVDIETNSTIDAEAAQDKQDIAELLNGLSQFFAMAGPLIKEGVLPFEIAREMLLTVTRRYNFGNQLEDSIMKMGPPPKPEEDPADKIKLQAIQAKAQADAAQSQADIQRIQIETQAMQAEAATKQQIAQAELAIKKEELLIKQQELELKRQEMNIQAAALQTKAQLTQIQGNMKLQQMQDKATLDKQITEDKANAAKKQAKEKSNATV